jgi:hypothetical protein
MPDNLLTASDAKVRDHGLWALEARVDPLTEQVITHLRSAEPTYRGVPRGELQMDKSIENVLKTCRCPAKDRENTTGWAREVGSRRAERGVPLAAMTDAYRIGGQTLVDSFLWWAGDKGLPTERSKILAEDIRSAVYLHRDAAIGAYRAAGGEVPTSLGAEAGHQPDEIFVCYRRADTRHAAGRLADHLKAEFGRESVFIDVVRWNREKTTSTP